MDKKGDRLLFGLKGFKGTGITRFLIGDFVG